MQTVGTKAEDGIAFGDRCASDQPRPFHSTDGEPGEVIVTGGVQARHFRRFAADQGAARPPAPFGDPGDNLRCPVDIKPAGGEVVQEEQGFCALHDQIVHAHRDKIDADRVMPTDCAGDGQLGSHAVGGRHQ